MSDFPFEAVFYSFLIFLAFGKLWLKYRDEMKKRHKLERLLMKCRQDLLLEREARKQKGLSEDNPSTSPSPE